MNSTHGVGKITTTTTTTRIPTTKIWINRHILAYRIRSSSIVWFIFVWCMLNLLRVWNNFEKEKSQFDCNNTQTNAIQRDDTAVFALLIHTQIECKWYILYNLKRINHHHHHAMHAVISYRVSLTCAPSTQLKYYSCKLEMETKNRRKKPFPIQLNVIIVNGGQ